MDKLLEKLVAIRSVCGHEEASREIIDFTALYLEERGLKVERFLSHGFHSLYTSPTGNKTPKLLLVSHLDVVAAPDELFTLTLKDGIYRGRGVYDMKFAAASYLHIIDRLQDHIQEFDIGVMFTTDEEVYGPYGTGMLVEKGYIPEIVVLPDCGENWEIEEFAKGRWFAEIKTEGVSAHGSRPWLGDNAIMRLIPALTEITDLFKSAQQPETDTINVGVIEGGKVVNQIAASASAHIDIRYMSAVGFEKTKQAIQAICEKYNATIRPLADENDPVVVDLSHPAIKTFTRLVKQETGVTPRPTRSFGTSDARFFMPHDVTCVLSAPPGGHRHSDEEWLEAKGYEQFQRILQRYITEVAHIPASARRELATRY